MFSSSQSQLHVTTSSSHGITDEYNNPSQETALLGGTNKDQRGFYLAVPTGIF